MFPFLLFLDDNSLKKSLSIPVCRLNKADLYNVYTQAFLFFLISLFFIIFFSPPSETHFFLFLITFFYYCDLFISST